MPAVVGLLVLPEFRRQGVAGALLDAAGQLANELGYDELFISTSILGEFLQRKGWREKGDVDFMNGERGKVYVRSLTAVREP
jgi:GNAT superfamily N-acetyltransferase